MTDRKAALLYGCIGTVAIILAFMILFEDNWGGKAKDCYERGGNQYNSFQDKCWKKELLK